MPFSGLRFHRDCLTACEKKLINPGLVTGVRDEINIQ